MTKEYLYSVAGKSRNATKSVGATFGRSYARSGFQKEVFGKDENV